ncbi:MAG: VOC family protein [Pseudomonadota bacterium]
MITTLAPFLAFSGQGRDALQTYANALPGAEVLHVHPYGPDEEGEEGQLRLAVLCIGEIYLRIIDVPVSAGFSFSGAMSIHVVLDKAEEVDKVATALGVTMTLMPPDSYPFAERFAWIVDRFGVHWQLVFGGILPGAGKS